MTAFPISDEWRFRLFAATRDLIKACGGCDRAGALAGVSGKSASNWQNTTVIPVLAAIALEADCGHPYVTSIMAEFTGREVKATKEEVGSEPAGNIDLLHNEMMRQCLEASRLFIEARTGGLLSPVDAEVLGRSAADLARAVERYRNGLCVVKATPHENVCRIQIK